MTDAADTRRQAERVLFGPEHVRRYLETDGAQGHDWQGTHTLILGTRGRRSGERRQTPLIYRRDGDRVLVVASQGGAPRHPRWYENLVADPDVEVQIRGERFRARARTATPEERASLWPGLVEQWPAFADYERRTERLIPVVILERAG